jgi:hypothetical protein
MVMYPVSVYSFIYTPKVSLHTSCIWRVHPMWAYTLGVHRTHISKHAVTHSHTHTYTSWLVDHLPFHTFSHLVFYFIFVFILSSCIAYNNVDQHMAMVVHIHHIYTFTQCNWLYIYTCITFLYWNKHMQHTYIVCHRFILGLVCITMRQLPQGNIWQCHHHRFLLC